MAQQSRIKVKVTNNDDTRLWRYSRTTDYAGLCTFIQSVWNNEDFIAQYADDEGDLITIASAQDLADAFDLAMEEQKKSLKLFVKLDVKQKRAQKQRQTQQPPTITTASQSEEKKEEEQSPKQFGSVREMIVDFLSNAEITALLPELFASLVKTLTETAKQLADGPRLLKPAEISQLLIRELKDPRFDVVTGHVLYRQYASLAIPLVASKVHCQQQLYPHFNVSTIKMWVTQLLGMLTQVMQQMQGKECHFKDVVLDIEYPAKTDTGKVIHFGVECDLCGMYPIIGDRYKSAVHEDWDCCSACEPQHDQPLIKFKKANKKCGNAFKGLAEMMQKMSVQPTDEPKVEEKEDEKQDVLADVEADVEAMEREDSVPMDVEFEQSAELVEPPMMDLEVEAEAVDDFVYAGQLAQIKEIMGLQGGEKDETIKTMLVQHKGDIAKVVPMLLR